MGGGKTLHERVGYFPMNFENYANSSRKQNLLIILLHASTM